MCYFLQEVSIPKPNPNKKRCLDQFQIYITLLLPFALEEDEPEEPESESVDDNKGSSINSSGLFILFFYAQFQEVDQKRLAVWRALSERLPSRGKLVR